MRRITTSRFFLPSFLPSFLLILVFCMAGCNTGLVEQSSSHKKQAAKAKNSVTIIKHTNDPAISSFQTNVKVYEENNRSPNGQILKEEYRLSLKIIDSQIFTRIDYPVDEAGFARTVVSSPSEIVVFNRITNTVECRVPVTPDDEADNADSESLFGRIPLDEIIAEYSRLSYRVTDVAEEDMFAIETPTDLLHDILIGGNPMKSDVVFFDKNLDVYCGSEYSVIDENNVRIDIKESIDYQEVDGVPIQTGKSTERKYTYPARINTSDRLIPEIETVDSLPEMSESELNDLVSKGAQVMSFEPILGDPGVLDYVETTVEMYDSIELNGLDDSLFRPNL